MNRRVVNKEDVSVGKNKTGRKPKQEYDKYTGST